MVQIDLKLISLNSVDVGQLVINSFLRLIDFVELESID